jgi:hypothetical protein
MDLKETGCEFAHWIRTEDCKKAGVEIDGGYKHICIFRYHNAISSSLVGTSVLLSSFTEIIFSILPKISRPIRREGHLSKRVPV